VNSTSNAENLALEGENVPSLEALTPFQIVSLFDMLEFNARTFLEAVENVEFINTLSDHQDRTKLVGKADIDGATDMLKRLHIQCSRAGLDVTANLVNDSIIRFSLSEEFHPTYEIAREEARTIKRTMHAELKSVLFMRIPKSDIAYYEANNLFGEDVAKNYQSAAYDISEAGKCLATNRSTACVLHLMRVLELGLGSLAKVFNVPFQRANWNTIIEQVESEIGKIDKAQNKPVNWKDDRKFYSTAANQFRFFKDSWRNYAMHIHDKYTPEEALIIYTSVKAFMGHIAAKLSE
jgi:hypothetical protein